MTKCAWASIDENGNLKGGEAGNQTGKELKVANWYNFNQNVVYRFKDRSLAKRYAKAIKSMALNKAIGYDQNQRTTLYTQLKKIDFNYEKLTVKCECDCSSLTAAALIAVGVDVPHSMTTSTLNAALEKTGLFEKLTASKYLTSGDYLLTGDIINKPASHVISAVEDGCKSAVIVDKYTLKEFVTEVQTATGAKVDGIAGKETLSKTVTVNVAKGLNVRHAVVKPLQKRFNSLGYDCGTADGIAGSKFKAALLKYQKDHGCVADGELAAGKTTWKLLLGM